MNAALTFSTGNACVGVFGGPAQSGAGVTAVRTPAKPPTLCLVYGRKYIRIGCGRTEDSSGIFFLFQERGICQRASSGREECEDKDAPEMTDLPEEKGISRESSRAPSVGPACRWPRRDRDSASPRPIRGILSVRVPRVLSPPVVGLILAHPLE